MKSIAFFNSTAGVGKTTLVYHLASMMAERGKSVLAVDLDPQAALTSMFIAEDQLKNWSEAEYPPTLFGALLPRVKGFREEIPLSIANEGHFPVAEINPKLFLLVGDPKLSTLEDDWFEAWSKCREGSKSAFLIMSAFHRKIREAAEAVDAECILMDVGSNLGALTRAALLASEQVVIPLGPDLFSLQGLRNLGPKLKEWRGIWQQLIIKNSDLALDWPSGTIEPLGYIVMQHGLRGNRPPRAYLRWIERFPSAYREAMSLPEDAVVGTADDPYCLAMLTHYRSLIPMAMEARKPVFALKPADGAIGAHNEAVRRAYLDFQELASRIIERSGGLLQ